MLISLVLGFLIASELFSIYLIRKKGNVPSPIRIVFDVVVFVLLLVVLRQMAVDQLSQVLWLGYLVIAVAKLCFYAFYNGRQTSPKPPA